jgi:hypothetical protein
VSVLTFTLTIARATYIEAEVDKSTGIANSADAVEITVTLTDENNLPIVGKSVELTTDFGTLFMNPSGTNVRARVMNPSGTTVLTRDNGNGTYTAFLRSEEPGEATITVTIDGVVQPKQLFVEFIMPGATASTMTASPSEIRANGFDTSKITVSLYDADGALLSAGGDTVVLTATLGTLSAVTDNANGTYSATLTAGTEPGIAMISGSANGIEIDAQTTIRFSDYQHAIQDAFTNVTSAFIQRRMDRILTAEPRVHQLDRRRLATSIPQFSVEQRSSSGEMSSHMQMAGQIGQTPHGSVDIAASDASPSSNLRFFGNAASNDYDWYFWTEGYFTTYKDGTGALADRDGRGAILFLGVDYLVNERLTFGLMANADRTSERINGYSDVSGSGWMVGPYLSAEITEHLFFTGRVAWGRSTNSVLLNEFSDNAQWRGDFRTERFLARGAIYGSFNLGRSHVKPQIELASMRENQEDYVASDGSSEVSVAGIGAEIGRLTLSTEIDWPIGPAFGKLHAFVVPEFDWDFNTSALTGTDNQTRGSLELGLRRTPDAGWRGEAAVRYDGIGQPDFSSWNLRLGAQIEF